MLRIDGRAWDEFDVYLFDIDGTLINCKDATHYFAFCQVLTELAGRELTLEGVVAHGNTDTGILRDALTLAGIPEDHWRARMPEVREQMGDFVTAHTGELHAEVLPGVRQILTHLYGRGAKLGVATGNFERIGQLKLESAGLFSFFDFAGWSDGYETRTEVFRAAVQKARSLYGETAKMCVLGDTPADVRAAHAVGLPVIAVATGVFSFEQLMQEQPEACLRSLLELSLTFADR